MVKILVLSVNTAPSPNLEIFKRSCKRYGYDYEILGLGEVWKGWQWRTQVYIDAIKDHYDIDIFILCDSDDLYFTGPCSEFFEKFLAFHSDVGIGTEDACGTGDDPAEIKKERVKTLKSIHISKKISSIYYGLNGGCIFGYRGSLLEILKINLREKDDQVGYTKLFINDTPLIAPDYYQRIVGNCAQRLPLRESGVDEWKIKNDRVYNIKTGTYPVIMHYPGKNFYFYKLFLHPSDKSIRLSTTSENYNILRKCGYFLTKYFWIYILIIISIIFLVTWHRYKK